MRKLGLAILPLLFSVTAAFAGGPEVPFPLREQIPVPLPLLQGIWEARGDDGYRALFSFELRDDRKGGRELMIMALDPVNQSPNASGEALAVSDGEVLIRAIMRGRTAAYILIVRAFGTASKPSAFLLTFRSVDSPELDVRHFVLRKLADAPFILPTPVRPKAAAKKVQTNPEKNFS